METILVIIFASMFAAIVASMMVVVLHDEPKEIIKKTKTCKRCRHEKTSDAFSKNSKQVDGLTVWCNECMKKSRTQGRKP